MMLASFLFTDEKIFTAATPKNPQNDRLYEHPSNKKRSVTVVNWTFHVSIWLRTGDGRLPMPVPHLGTLNLTVSRILILLCKPSNATLRLPVHVRYMLSPVRLSSVVCNARAPYSGGSNLPQYFYGIWYLGHPLTSTENSTEIVPGEPLRRGS